MLLRPCPDVCYGCAITIPNQLFAYHRTCESPSNRDFQTPPLGENISVDSSRVIGASGKKGLKLLRCGAVVNAQTVPVCSARAG